MSAVYDEILACEMLPGEMSRGEYVLLAESLDFLEHYHRVHSDEKKVSDWKGKTLDDVRVDVFAVSDPELQKKFRALMEESR